MTSVNHDESANTAACDPSSVASAQGGISIDRVFSSATESPFDTVTWEKRFARITDEKGETVFEQTDVDVPGSWSQLATNVVVSKYFYGGVGSPERETSVRQLIHRVTRTIADWGREDGLFATGDDVERFYDELTYLCLHQHASFNSPVWFNVGLYHQAGIEGSEGNFHWSGETSCPVRTERGYEYPQASACFIQGVEDNMEDIMRLAAQEAMLFKYGSGTGTDLSTLRSSREKLSGGGTPSGPLSFMRVYDQIAGVIKSGGKTRRAAKMQSLRCDHPDIREFIACKMEEEKKAWALIEQGYDGSFNGDAYNSVMFQNANTSVRATDEFMQAAEDDAPWQTFAVTTGEPVESYPARELLELIAEGTHVCGDPGVQFHSTINRWHTCPASGEIRASNPCSEYMFLDDSACNLASLNLLKFRRPDGSLDVERFRAAARVVTIAQEILVDHASYPSDRICRNSHDYRPLGLGYANLGALLMSLGMPYDSDAGRATAAAITAILTASAYATSAELASRVGAFPQYRPNRDAMLRVMEMHRGAVEEIPAAPCPDGLLDAARGGWARALAAGRQFGYRNAQVTVLAPTGTIGFMMDCDTTGIEPDIALVKHKLLAGGGTFKIVNRTVPLALERLGYSSEQIAEIIEYVDDRETIEGAPHLTEEHLAVFDCAFRPAGGQRNIHYMGHIRMMGAVQPFLSGAISKTVNLPKEATVEEIMQVYTEAWKLGLKAVAIYRDGSKRTQPLHVGKKKDAHGTKVAPETGQVTISLDEFEAAKRTPHRHRLPATRPSITHKFDVAGHEGYLNVGLYEDGTPGELFITMAKEGSTVGGMMDAFATAISLCLQYGVPLEALVKKFSHQRFEPSGMTRHPEIPFAKSIVDYVFRWLGLSFLEEGTSPKSGQVGGTVSTSSQAAPEAVKEDASSEPGSADGVSHTDVKRPVGASSSRSAAGQEAPKPGGNGHGTRGEDAPDGGRSDTQAAAPAPPGRTKTPRRVPADRPVRKGRQDGLDRQFSQYQEDAPACDCCGSITVRNGNCYKCYICGSSLGCS